MLASIVKSHQPFNACKMQQFCEPFVLPSTKTMHILAPKDGKSYLAGRLPALSRDAAAAAGCALCRMS